MPIPGNMLSSVTEQVDPNTSGWTTMLNAALGLGVGGRNGPGCLVVGSLAAGEMRARTVSSYDVNPGTVYQVFADGAGTVGERIGIRWLNSLGAEAGVAWSMTTATPSGSFHRVGVAAACPANATRAQVMLSSTPAAAGVNQYWENVYLGLPIRTPGNLMPFGVETVEVDASRWVSEVNATAARQAPMVVWPVDNYAVGGHVLGVVAVAAGNAAVRTVDRPAVTPGTEYLAYSYLNPPTTTADAWIELRYYDASNTQLSATRGPLAAPGTAWYRQQVAAVAPPTAATCGITVGFTSTAAGQVMRAEQVVVTVAPQIRAGSLMPYADGSFEQGVVGWTRTAGAATLTRSTPWGAYGLDDSAYALTVTSATATVSTIRSAKFPLTPGADGLPHQMQFAAQVTAGGWTTTRGIRWYDAGGTDLGVTAGPAGAVPTPGWWLLGSENSAPIGATSAAVELTLTATAVSSVLRLESVTAQEVVSITSVKVIPATASTILTLRELLIDDQIRVYRQTEDGRRTLVRGPAGLYNGTIITSDLLVIEDYEAPLVTPFTYLIEIIDAFDGSVSNRSSAVVTIPQDDPSYCWLRDPGNPQRNVSLEAVTAPDWQRPARQAAYAVRGRRNAVILSDRRGGLEGNLVVRTQSDTDREDLGLLLDSGNPLLLQFIPGLGLEDRYVAVSDATEARIMPYGGEPRRLWTLPLIEQDMPVTTGVNGSAGRTWTDVISEFATCEDLLAAYATCEALLINRRS